LNSLRRRFGCRAFDPVGADSSTWVMALEHKKQKIFTFCMAIFNRFGMDKGHPRAYFYIRTLKWFVYKKQSKGT
jgi:hypothetical protein